MKVRNNYENELREELRKIFFSVRNMMQLTDKDHKRIEEIRGELYKNFHAKMIEESKRSKESNFYFGTERLPCDYKI